MLTNQLLPDAAQRGDVTAPYPQCRVLYGRRAVFDCDGAAGAFYGEHCQPDGDHRCWRYRPACFASRVMRITNEYSFRGMPPALRERYFRHMHGHGYQLDERVRAMVEFHSLNLLAPSLPSCLLISISFFATCRSTLTCPRASAFSRRCMRRCGSRAMLVLEFCRDFGQRSGCIPSG